MSQALPLITADRLHPLLNYGAVLAAVKEALIWQAEGKVQSPLPGQLLFPATNGDCHIKFGHVAGSPTFAIKVATGFYDNPKRGLPVNHGLVIVLDASSGKPQVIFQDQGWLTAWRTAAAAALAAKALAPEKLSCVGIFGTGLQASLALDWLPQTLGPVSFLVLGRDAARTQDFAKEARARSHKVEAAASAADLLAQVDLVLTATPSAQALFDAKGARPGQHFVALGADSPGKQELPTALFSRAARIVTDDIAQALDHGDYGNAVRAGAVKQGSAEMLGDLLAGKLAARRGADDITIADLTGIAAEDIAISGLFARLLAQR